MDWSEAGSPAPHFRRLSALRGGFLLGVLLLACAAAASAQTINSIVANPPPPQLGGTTITWTANVSGGIAPLQYKWLRLNVGTGNWDIAKDWNTTNSFAWATTQANVGTWSLQLWIRNNGSTAPYDNYSTTGNFSITSTTPSVTNFAANTTFPRNFGTTITWTPTILGGLPPFQYKYLRYSQATGLWTIVQDWSATRTFSWTTTSNDVGRYSLQVWVRNNGSTAVYDAYAGYANFDITAPPPTITSFATQTTFPTPAGRPITWTVTTTGGLAPLQFRFLRYSVAAGTFTLLQDYGAANSVSWEPVNGEQGQYSLQVWVRNRNSSLAYDAYTNTPVFDILPPTPLTVTGITVAPGVPRPVGSILQWKATATGGVAPVQYKFLRYNYGTSQWTIAQDYSTNDTFVWTPAPTDVNDYTIQVWARSAGSTAAYESYGDFNRFTITADISDVVRFLEQATFGPNDALIEQVRQMGYSAWIDAQFATPTSGFPVYPTVPDNPDVNCDATCQRDNYSMYGLQNQFFLNAFYSNDQLRQRVGWTLHELVVVSGLDISLPSWLQPYLDIFQRNAFGNYRQFLAEITINPAMGEYLNLDTSTKFQPNENYAREILQLFTTGTDLLNPDGTPQTLSSGEIIPVYDQFAITQFAKILTGWRLANDIGPGITNYRDQLVPITANHDLGSKTLLLGTVTPPGQTPLNDLNAALDNIFNHPNVGPYIAKHFIRKMVTSNPSPAYVQRVAAKFNNNGSGVRGDLKAVIKAVLLDAEARSPSPSANEGHLREPVLFMTNLLRAFNVRSANGQALSDGNLAVQAVNLGMDVLRPPTVFSYYPADYLTPGTTIFGPEFGVYQTTTTLRRANFVNTMAFSNIPVSLPDRPLGTSIDLTPLVSIANNPDGLVKEVDRLLLHNTMSDNMKRSILHALSLVPASNPLLRAQTALYLVATSSQYQVER